MSDIELFGPLLDQEDIRSVTECLKQGWYGDQKYLIVEDFERNFAESHDRSFGLMTPNCTSALYLTLWALGIGPGDEVIVPDCTWIGSSASINRLGAKTVFCDIDRQSWCLSIGSLKKSITAATKAVIYVDLYGNIGNIEAIETFCRGAGIPLIEDAAGAIGSVRNHRKAGSFGTASVFSFHRTKTITTGEGGMVLINNQELYERMSFLRDHGRNSTKMYFNEEVTFKFMPSALAASLGQSQFNKLQHLISIKRDLLNYYRTYFNSPGFSLNTEPPAGVNGAWASILMWDDKFYHLSKEKVIERLVADNFEARPFFYPLSSMPAYQSEKVDYESSNPVAYKISNYAICLPSALNLTPKLVEPYCEKLKEIFDRC